MGLPVTHGSQIIAAKDAAKIRLSVSRASQKWNVFLACRAFQLSLGKAVRPPDGCVVGAVDAPGGGEGGLAALRPSSRMSRQVAEHMTRGCSRGRACAALRRHHLGRVVSRGRRTDAAKARGDSAGVSRRIARRSLGVALPSRGPAACCMSGGSRHCRRLRRMCAPPFGFGPSSLAQALYLPLRGRCTMLGAASVESYIEGTVHYEDRRFA
jgi:hypothetical protein